MAPIDSEKGDRLEPLPVQSQRRSTRISRRAVLVLSILSFLLYQNKSLLIGDCLHKYQKDDGFALCSADGKRDIYTVDETNTKVECIAVKDGVITEVGSKDDVKGYNVKTIPEGSIVIPGMSDSHVHTLEYGASRLIPLEAGKTVEETVSSVREYILSNPEFANNKSKVVEGWGWNHLGWPTQKFPTAADLDSDSVIFGRKVILESKDGHAFWVSGAVLNDSLPFPDSIEGGTIVRDDTGEPTGVLLDNAQTLVERPVLTEEDLTKRFHLAVEDCFKFGLTSIHDAMLKPYSLAFFKRLAEEGNLPIRLRGMRYFDEADGYWGNTTSPIFNAGNGRYSARSVKFVADGSMRAGGAAMEEPYSDDPSTRGFMRVPASTLNEVVPLFLRDGWQVNIHAIGDRANRLVLDAFEAALKSSDSGVSYNTSDIRPRLEHAQIVDEQDVGRFGELGIIASIQPTHVISDMYYALSRLGPERIKNLYAFRSILNGGARITLGSDFPVESPNPMVGFYAAITRESKEGGSPMGDGGWFPNQRLTRLEALRGTTIDPAYASFTEDILGSLEKGKKADFVVLNKDIMEVEPKEILKTKVTSTVLDGEVVYGEL